MCFSQGLNSSQVLLAPNGSCILCVYHSSRWPPLRQYNKILSLTCLDMPVASGRLLLCFGGWSSSGQAIALFLLPGPLLPSTRRRASTLSGPLELTPSAVTFWLLIAVLPGLCPAKGSSVFHVTEPSGRFTLLDLLDVSAALE